MALFHKFLLDMWYIASSSSSEDNLSGCYGMTVQGK